MDKRYKSYQFVSLQKLDDLLIILETYKTLIQMGLAKSPHEVHAVNSNLLDTVFFDL